LHRLVQFPDGAFRPVVEPYIPREGDMVFFDDYSTKWECLFRAVGTGPPFHSAIVFRLPNGLPAVIEAGADDGLVVAIEPAYQRLRRFKGDIWIRRCKRALTHEESRRLTEFALEQDGKPYAVTRLLMQATALRCRMGLRYQLFARTYLDRDSWLCSELVVAAGTVANLFDPKLHPANAMYPRDLVTDRYYSLRHNWEDPGLWEPSPQPVQGSLAPRL
jgi:hypothetical protein